MSEAKSREELIADRDRAKQIYEDLNTVIESSSLDAEQKRQAEAEAQEKAARDFARKAGHASPQEYAAMRRERIGG